jgi:hypothetical protein
MKCNRLQPAPMLQDPGLRRKRGSRPVVGSPVPPVASELAVERRRQDRLVADGDVCLHVADASYARDGCGYRDGTGDEVARYRAPSRNAARSASNGSQRG